VPLVTPLGERQDEFVNAEVNGRTITSASPAQKTADSENTADLADTVPDLRGMMEEKRRIPSKDPSWLACDAL